MDTMARDSYEPRAPLPDVYDEEPRMLKRRRSVSPRRGPDHYEPARQRSPRPSVSTVNGYPIDPTRTDPDYLAWIARQRAREEERRAGPQAWAGGDDDWERSRWRNERDFDEPPHMRERAYDDDRYAPRMRPEDDWDRAPSRGRSYREDDPYGPSGADRRGAYPGPGYPGGRDGRPIDPLDLDGLLPFKRFAQLLRESGHEPAALSSSPAASAELYEKYTAYRSTYQSRAMRRFFDEHREQPWFKEKYGLGETEVAARIARRKRGRVGTKARWLEELRSGKLDQVCLDVKLASPELLATLEGGLAAYEGRGLLATTTRDGEPEVLHDPETAVTPANPHEVMIRSVPVELPRADLETALAKLPGFQYLAMGEPHQSKRYGRMGWVVFDADTDMAEAMSSLQSLPVGDGKLTYETTDRAAHARMRIAPPQASALPRLAHDLRQARELVATLEREDRKLWHDELDAIPADAAVPEELAWLEVDASAEIEQRCAHLDVGRGELSWEELERQAAGGEPTRAEGDDETEVKAEDKPADLSPARLREILTKHLDLHLDLLRYVWHCDYYATIMCDVAEELVRRAPRHLRRVESNLQLEKGWADSLDQKHQLLVAPQTVDLEIYGGRNLEKELQDLAAPYSQLDEAEKHRCIVPVTPADGDTAEVLCNKPFRAAIFVRKHVVNKHRAFLDQIAGNKIRDIEAYNAYILDPARTMPTLQAPGARDGGRQSGAGQPRGTPQLAQRIGMPRNQSFDSPGMLGNLPMHAPPLSLMNVGSGMPMGMGVPVPFAAAGAQFGPLIRMGGSMPVQESPVAARRGARPSERSEAALGSRLGPAPLANDLIASEPLPEPPRPLDPRARGAPKRYEDLDSAGDGEAGELALEY